MRGTNHDDFPPRQSPSAALFFVVVFINRPDQPKDLVESYSQKLVTARKGRAAYRGGVLASTSPLKE